MRNRQTSISKKENQIPACESFVQLAPPPWRIEPVKTNNGVPNSGNCKHSVPCGDQVWLTRAKDQEGVQPAVFSLSESVSNLKVLLARERPAAPAFRRRSRKQTRGLHRHLSKPWQPGVNTVMIYPQICAHWSSDVSSVFLQNKKKKKLTLFSLFYDANIYIFKKAADKVKWIQKVFTKKSITSLIITICFFFCFIY